MTIATLSLSVVFMNNLIIIFTLGISKSTIFTWIKESKNKDEIKIKPGRKALVEGDKELESELTEVTKENDQLKKLLGEKDLEIAILKDLIKKSNPQLKIK
ncbi:MAG: hypothetical protein ACFWTK_10795 [Clostridium sp.]